jgi:osmoprotectant transport system ATP-binding protein
VIRLERLGKRFGRQYAVKELDLEVAEGEFVCLIGPSGCGKSTTLKMINRLVEPEEGRVLVGGRDVRQVRPELLRRRMGYVIQSIGLFPHMSVEENICVVPGLLGWERERGRRRAAELLELFDLEPGAYGPKRPSQLSGGEAQRVGVARALAADPEILLMDEPFGALDPITRDRLQSQFARIASELGKTIVFVTHDIDEAIRLSSRMVLMRAGELVQEGPPEELLAHPADRFAKEFIGADRALKRLSRLLVEEVVRPAPWLPVDAAAEEVEREFAGLGERPGCFLWVASRQGRLLGWADRQGEGGLEQRLVEVEPREFALRPQDSLRHALSVLLWQGVACAPVVDGAGRITGELWLQDLLRS